MGNLSGYSKQEMTPCNVDYLPASATSVQGIFLTKLITDNYS